MTVAVTRLLALLIAGLAGCQPTAPSQIPTTDARVATGAVRTCAELGFSDVRCSLVRLRAARELETDRPDARPTAQELHEALAPVTSQSPLPVSQVAVAVVVFTLEDGSRIGVPVLCPREPSGSDPACNPQVE